MAMRYWVYILASRKNGTLYIGVTNDIARRGSEHRQGIGSHEGKGGGRWRLDVTRTVAEWMRGARPNEDFTIAPDLDRVMGFYNATDEGGFMCDMGINGFELVVTAAVPGA